MSDGRGRPPRGATAERTTAAEQELAVHRRLMRFGDHESRVAPVWSEKDTSVAAVEGHLARLWTLAGDDGPRVTEKGMPHARASVLNLIVTVPDEPSADRVVSTLLGLGFRHPSRAIVLVANRHADGPAVDASVSAHCHAIHDADEQVCYEEVVLTVRGEAAEHLDGVVAPLLIHDLPTLVWWPGNPPFADPIFDQLVEMGDRLILDSSDFGDLLLGLRRLSTLRRRSGMADLAWKRLGWWQELTAQFFDAPRFRRYLPNLNRVVIRYALAPTSGSAPPAEPDFPAPGVASPIAQAMLYASWIASRLEWKRHSTVEPLSEGRLALTLEGRYAMVELRIEGEATGQVPEGDLLSVRLRARGETGAAEFIIDRDGDEAIAASNADGMTAQLRRVRMELPTDSELLASTMVAGTHEPVYEAAVRAAGVLLAAARPVEEAGVTREFIVLEDANAVALTTAQRVITAGEEAIARHGRFFFALTGGSTPLMVCPLLVVPPLVNALDWSKVEFFFGDERAVPSRHPESNYNLARTALLDYLPGVRPGQVHRMIGEAADLDAACRAYEALIARTLGAPHGAVSSFDLIWLGMGSDGHTASLFPDTAAMDEASRWVVPNWVPKLDAWRMTMTYPLLNAAREVDFVVTGADKAAAVAAVRDGPGDVPAARIEAGRTVWYVDRAAAGSGEPAASGEASGRAASG